MRCTAWLIVAGMFLLGCPSDDPVSPSDDAGATLPDSVQADSAEPSTPDSSSPPPECLQDLDCGELTPCTLSHSCVEGECKSLFAEAGADCSQGCSVGACNAEGVCEESGGKECPEQDGNTCTAPTCIGEGECAEVVIADGEPPYASSECFDGAVCIGGDVDTAEAAPTVLAQECATLSSTLDPLGCIASYVCVGGEEGCRPVVKPEGTQCWPQEDSSAAGDTCTGFSCVEGVCTEDSAYDEICDASAYPASCDEACQSCTQLSCHWIEDPAAAGEGGGRVAYCQPAAELGAACDSDPCLVDQACGFASQADGPLGKETLGACVGGAEKTPAQCLEEQGKPALPCLLAGTTCDSEQGGCVLEQATADSWCYPPANLCWEQNDTYCTHLDVGGNWSSETGCHIGWVELNCEDGNPCTEGACKPEGGDFACEQTALSGLACDDGDPCTVGGACVLDDCTGHQPKCADNDELLCNDQACNPETALCEPADVEGLECDDGDACTSGDQCVSGACAGPLETPCDDNNPCTDDSCNATSGCVHIDNTEPCQSENLCAEVALCQEGACVLQTPKACDDENPCTEDLCDPETGCQNPVVPSGTPCLGTGVCFKEECCIPSCAPGTCAADGCGGTCVCDSGSECVEGLCESSGDSDLNGTWLVTADPSTKSILGGLGTATFVPVTITLTVNGSNVTGVMTVLGITLNYTGTVTGTTFSLSTSYDDPSGISHQESWQCVLESPTEFTGVINDSMSLLGISVGNVVWDITGIKQ